MLKIIFVLNLIFLQLAFADVFPDTPNTRRALTTEEQQHLLHLGVFGKGGCSASALTPEILITAEHCLPRYPDGETDFEMANGYFEFNPNDTFAVQTTYDKRLKRKVPVILDVSSHYGNDVIIVKIKWTKGSAPAELKYTREMVISESELSFGTEDDAVATPLYTIGYPRDLDRRATHSSGFLKNKSFASAPATLKDPYSYPPAPFEEPLFLDVNVSTTNGNSGGAVFTGNYKLVGIVHGGRYVDPETAAKSPISSQNPLYWNRIAALYHLYPKMKTLQALFPNGINPNVDENGAWIGK